VASEAKRHNQQSTCRIQKVLSGTTLMLAFGEQLALKLRARQKVPIWGMIGHGGFEKL